ncbi:MAG: DegT/DnrJ/EryC1/StrS family aminotransferase [Bacteroidetes bacterium]|nr:DegT/DnrJ/EryC1/StrS family aminotransferase [Bacteroidota bacterium]
MRVPYIDINAQHIPIKGELLAEVEKILTSGQFILGKAVEEFEKKFAELCQTKYAIGVANGTDALVLAMKVLGIGPGDEVITAPNSFLASASSIVLVGATPVFADVRDDFNIDPQAVRNAITPQTKAIIPVHLTGRPADMDAICEIANEEGIFIIEDAAQAVGATYKDKAVGSIGTMACFSLHPLKNLSASGDGGVITTNDRELKNKLLLLRNHGLKNRDECVEWSLNSRLDEVQAAILNVKLSHLESWNQRRRYLASIYQSTLVDYVVVPKDNEKEKAVYHTFIIQTEKRDDLQAFLFNNEIETKIHYPIPIHLQEAAKELNYRDGSFPVTEKQVQEILSLPIYPELGDDQVHYVCNKIVEFFKERK